MTLEELIACAELDLEMDKTELATESMNTPVRYGRWLKYRSTESKLLKKYQLQFDALRKDKWLYYSGKASPEVYKDNPFNLKVMKNEVDLFIDADREILQLKGNIELQKEKVKFIEDVAHMIKNRDWQIRNAIEFQKMMLGA